MSTPDFSNGKWTGFYSYGGCRKQHRMDMTLLLTGGIIRGYGDDKVGRFEIRGRFDPKAKAATWTKTYLGRHAVFYRGFRDAFQESIWGSWEIDAKWKGGFKIWPVGSADGVVETAIEPEPKPMPEGLSVFVYKRVDPPNVKSNDA